MRKTKIIRRLYVIQNTVNLATEGVIYMTRREFINEVTTWGDLIMFCSNEDLEHCRNVIDDEFLEEEMMPEDLRYALDDGWSWAEIREKLMGIDPDYEYYVCNGTLDYYPLDDSDFEVYKQEVLDYMEGSWDQDEEITAYVPTVEPEDEPAPTEEISIDELIKFSCQQVFA